MAGKRTVFDREKAFLSIIGAGAGEPQEQEKQLKEEIKEEHLQSEQVATPEPKKRKKRGRKKLENREKKKQYSFTILPSVYEKAQAKAEKEGKALSELISNFLVKYGK